MIGNVIQFAPTASAFRLRETVAGNGKRVITNWLASYPGARARFRIRVIGLRRISKPWPIKQFRSLGDGLAEIKWEWEKKQWRAIGFDHNGYFVMVIGCTHKQNIYVPADCLKTARQRKSEVERGMWGIADYEP